MRVRCRFWLVLALAVGVSPRARGLGENERMQLADGLYARGMYDLAAREYEAFFRDYTNSAKADAAYFRLGESYRQLGNAIAAEKALRRVFNDYPKSPFRLRAGFRRACLFLDAGLCDSAVDLFQKVLLEKPPDDMACASLYFLADAMEKLGKTAEAVKVLEELGQRYPGTEFYSYGLLKLGGIHAKAGREDKALECFGKAAEKPGSDRVGAEGLFQVAETEFRRKDYKKSAETYRQLLSRYPQDRRTAEARLQAAWAAHNAGLYAEALQNVAEALKTPRGAEEHEWLYLKANCERQLVKNEDAARTYADLLKRFPNSTFANAALYEKALALYKTSRFAEAVAAAQAVRPTPELSKDLYWLMAESYAALGKEDEAIQYYQMLAREFPKSDLADDANYRLAHHLRGRGQIREAAQHYGAVATDYPDSPLAPQALFASASCLLQEGRHEEALRDWSALILKYGSSPFVEEAIYQKAMALVRLTRDEEALATLGDLQSRFPKSRFAADASYWRGVLYAKLGKREDAERELRAAIALKPRPELARDAEFRLAVVLQAAGKADEAAGLVESLMQTPFVESLPPELLRWLSEFRFEKKSYDAALAAAGALSERHREPVWQEAAWCLAGRTRMAKGDGAGARDAYQKALAAKGGTTFGAEAALRLGDLAMAATNAAAAVPYYQKAAAGSSDDAAVAVRAHAYAGLARAAKASGDRDGAARYFMSVAILYDDADLVPPCLFEAAGLFTELGKAEDGAKAAAELRERFPDSEWAKKLAAPPAAPATNAPAAAAAGGR